MASTGNGVGTAEEEGSKGFVYSGAGRSRVAMVWETDAVDGAGRREREGEITRGKHLTRRGRGTREVTYTDEGVLCTVEFCSW